MGEGDGSLMNWWVQYECTPLTHCGGHRFMLYRLNKCVVSESHPKNRGELHDTDADDGEE